MTAPRCLIVDDEPDIRELLTITLERMNIECRAAENLEEARQLLARQTFELCLTDMKLPDGDGIDLVTHIQKNYSDTPVAIITAYGSMESAIASLKAGAFDYLTKPVDLQNLRNIVTSALQLTSADRKSASSVNLVGDSPAIRELRATVDKLARSQAPIYISGESGTGKELVARLIHGKGPRAAHPFVPVNCGAIPGELMESEFFGHKKGSFTGAVTDKIGLFQAAHNGTLFLDEVADLPLNMQVKLLRAIQEKQIRPVGAHKEVPVDVRILSATHKDLGDMVNQGHFRQDLFYRINVIELQVPPLRERVEDIPLLVDSILKRLATSNAPDPLQVKIPVMTDRALQNLKKYTFPGNVRELENILERAMTLCENNKIQLEDLQLPEPGNLSQATSAIGNPKSVGNSLDPMLDNVEKETILHALEQTRWNKTKAAKLLGISFGALRYRLQKLELDKEGDK